jgi:RNA polymerase sigma-70 factor (ECF subfamily)
MIDEIDETQLREGLRAGDGATFEAIVRAYTGRMLAVTRRILRNDDEARDAVQEAFVSAYRARKQFDASAKISTWLHRIAVNAALMKLRRRRRKPEESIDPLLPDFRNDGHYAKPLVAWEAGADALVQRRETRAAVREAIDRLPESYRTVVMLRDIDGLDTEETAKQLGLTVNAVKIRLHRGRLALRTLLRPAFEGGAL